MMNLVKRIIPLLLVLAFFSGCSDDPQTPALGSAKEMQTFVLEAEHNPYALKQDIAATIAGNTITLEIPESVEQNRFVPTFTHTGKEVYVNGKKQQSGVSTVNMSEYPVYKVVAEDGTSNEYTVKMIRINDPGQKITAFAFEKETNPDLSRDFALKVNNDKISGLVYSPTTRLIATFETDAREVTVDGQPQVSGETVQDFSKPVIYTLTTQMGYQKKITVEVQWEAAIPHLYIVTEGKQPIVSKSDYLNATVTIDGKGFYEDYTGTTRVKGRGNSTWGLPKKPYRLKLDSKASLLGFGKEKDWVLLANYLDPTLMLNAVAMKTGQLLQVPCTNHIVPVDVTVNDVYMGNYMFTEQVEISDTRVNIDEKDGVLLELDANYDEDWKFKSTHYDLPVMVKDPDVESVAQMQKIQHDFQELEDSVASAAFPDNNYLKLIDADALVAYLIVYNFTHNMEINHPKSTYMHKARDGKYYMGPIWDFDWAFDYEGKNVHFSSYTTPLFGNIGVGAGRRFFCRLLEDPAIRKRYKQKWQDFRSSGLQELLAYVDAYAASIELSQASDYKKWGHGTANFKEEVAKLRNWLEGRASYIDEYVKEF